MGKAFVRGKEKYSLAEKKELGELVEKDKKEYYKEVKAICHFSMQKVSTWSNLAERYPINHFPPPQIFQPLLPQPLIIFYTNFQSPCLLETPHVYSGP